jgi:hypothetical protein
VRGREGREAADDALQDRAFLRRIADSFEGGVRGAEARGQLTGDFAAHTVQRGLAGEESARRETLDLCVVLLRPRP